MEREGMIPILLGADRGLSKKLYSLCSVPVFVFDTRFSFFDMLTPFRKCIKINSPELFMLYIEDIIKNTDKMPLLAASAEYRIFIDENREALAERCILWHEDFKF